ncbi:hypothetical protein MHBO_004854 [Bonamia ostreae]|uniref:Uncharacterized protein n=1 Tax=Bonamia ostreae TaxID=126728 RepID=A0ABV2AV77_9EUKA
MDVQEQEKHKLRKLYDEFSRIKENMNKEQCEELNAANPDFERELMQRKSDLKREHEAVIIAGISQEIVPRA